MSTALRAARALEEAGNLPAADEAYRALCAGQAPDPAALLAWGALRRRVGDLDNAEKILQGAVQRGGGAPAMTSLAAVYIDRQREGQQAAALLREASKAGRTAELEYEMARFEETAGRLEAAASFYRACTRADPKADRPRVALARVLWRLGRAEDAIAAYQALLKRDPRHMVALAELAYIYGNRHRFHESLQLYRSFEAAGGQAPAEISQAVLGLMHVGDWSDRAANMQLLIDHARVIGPAVVEAYAYLAGIDDPGLHRLMAGNYASTIRAINARRDPIPARTVGPADRRLRIAYFSGDFSQHATSLLFAAVAEAHDRETFEVFAYDYSPEDGSPTRARMEQAFEHFIRVGTEGPQATASRIAADEIDILIDMKGYTERSRTELLGLRPAPIQVNFLGYAGTQAAEWMDYVIADATVLPESEYHNWTEAPVLMPHSYYPNGNDRPRPAPITDRAAFGLPGAGTVFACFNNPFKISPESFAAFMDILRAVPDSVLWLYEGNPYIAANLRAEAKKAEIDPARLHFAPPAKLEDHLARHGAVDIFLDTVPYGAHTTACDALWMGVPLITCTGRSWASRVGASLLRAVDLPDLITADLAAFRAKAIALAADPAQRAAISAKLLAGRDTAPLFDAPGFARALEAAYTIMAQRARAGAPPAPFAVPA